MTAPNASRQSVAVSRSLYSSGRARGALARAATRIGRDFAARAPGPAGGRGARTVGDDADPRPRPPRPDRRRPGGHGRFLRAARDAPRAVRRRPPRAALRPAEAGAEGPITSVYVRDPDGNLVELSEPI